MNMLRNQLSVTLPIVGATVVISLALFFLLSWQPAREARRGFESKSRALASMLSTTVRAAVEFDDKDAAAKDLQAARAEGSLVYAAAFRGDGTQLAASGTPADLREARKAGQSTVEQDELWHVMVPLESQGKPIGWAQVGFSMKELSDSISSTRATSLAVAIVVLVAGLLGAVFVGRTAANRRTLLSQIAATANKLRSASENIQSSCNEQAAGTTEQAAAIDETRRTMDSLLEAAKRIADASQEVFTNADHTSRTTRTISDAIRELTNQAQKISDISEVIRSISDKSDLLALNASLEGTKAGEAGRGFALVAAEMRRLAESVMAAAREIKQLAANIRAASDSSVQAAEEGRTLAGRTSDSAKEITLVTNQQRNATEQVTRSMDEVSQLLTRSADGTRATERAAQAMLQLAEQLATLTSTFASTADTRALRS